jgi:ectoine hydroxylase-related dioxygenase (phytanoyl-CoA dioxygenase family)
MSTIVDPFVLSDHVRVPTDDEVAFFRESGWAHLPGLISAELAAAILAQVKSIVEFDYDEVPKDTQGAGAPSFTVKSFASRTMPRLENDFLRWFDESSEMGEVSARLTGIRPMRLVTDSVIYKLPQWTGAGDETDWHQDAVNMPVEPKTGAVQTWLALCDVSHDMGAMQHLTGSQKHGPVIESTESMHTWSLEEFLEAFPEMKRYPISESHDLKAGDALVHDGLCAHGAPANNTDRVRWAYTQYRFPASTRYVAKPTSPWLDSLGLKPGKPMDHELLPVVTK